MTGLNLIVVFVDVIIVLSANCAHISNIVDQLYTEYDVQDLGDLLYYLGIVIESDGIRKHQNPFYMTEIGNQLAHLPPCHLVSSSARSYNSRGVFGRDIMSLLFHISLYLAVHTRPDIFYAVML